MWTDYILSSPYPNGVLWAQFANSNNMIGRYYSNGQWLVGDYFIGLCPLGICTGAFAAYYAAKDDQTVLELPPSTFATIQVLKIPPVGTLEWVSLNDNRKSVCGVKAGYSSSGKPHYVAKAFCGWAEFKDVAGYYEPDGACPFVNLICLTYSCLDGSVLLLRGKYRNIYFKTE